MDRVLVCSLVIVLAGCSDDGAGAGGSGEGSGSLSAGSGEEGGTIATSASDASAGTGESTPSMQCMGDEDCLLVNSCCQCAAIHVDDPMPPCEIQECFAPLCDGNGIHNATARCRFGTCEIAPISCDPFLVVCDEAAPSCGEGALPSVVDTCWGPCVPAELCDVVPSCDDCPDDEACVQSSTQLGPSFACEPIDPSCAGTPDCTCMDAACEGPFVCVSAGDGDGADLVCECPTC